ncbi:MAG: porin, partial [Thiobacillus sp.]|nr:porin [Thiobacillus sp.]
MMKKILAVAIVSAFAAPAFAATANVDIYGVIGVSVDYVDGGSGGVNTLTAKPSESRARVSSNTSYIGFKGSEDLGGGLSAVWQIEQAVSIDQGSGTAASGGWAAGRNSFAGLSSKSLGSLTFGNQDTPYKTSTGKLDVFGGGQYLADYRSL